MKIKVKKKIFKEVVEKVSRILSGVNAFPSLNGILITVNQSSIELLGSNGTLSIKEIVETSDDINVIEPGQILVPGKMFLSVISSQGDNLEITKSDSKITILSDGAKTDVNLFDEEEYPKISFEAFGKNLTIDAEVIRNIIKNVAYAAANDDKKIILSGINLKASEGFLTATATNSFRVARDKVKINSDVEFDITILAKNLKDFIPQEVKGEIILNVDDSRILTKIKNLTISSKLIDGVYLPIDKLFGHEYKTKISIDKKMLEKLVERTTVLSGENKKIIKLTSSKDGNKIIGNSKKNEAGESVYETNDFSIEGEDISIVFDASFLKDAISKIDGKIELKFNGSFSPFLIKSSSNDELLSLILPHRTF